MKTILPTTFELAQLAAALPHNGSLDAACDSALELWQAAERTLSNHDTAVAQLNQLLNVGIFTLTDYEFRQHVSDYKGRDLPARLQARQYSADEVKRKLFPDKSLSNPTRDKLFAKLPTAAGALRVEYPWWLVGTRNTTERALEANGKPPLNFELGASMNGVVCRWLVSIRQAQKAESMKRIPPAPRRSRR